MAGRHLSLLRPFRKKKEGPGAAPTQHPEKMEQLHPLQEDPGRDQTREQDRARGRFRRAAQAFLKFLGIRRKRTTTGPTEVMAQPDPSPTELEADPDVTTTLTDGTGNCDTLPVVHTTKSDPALTDDPTDTDTPSIDRTAISDIPLTEEPTNSGAAPPDLTAEADTAMTEGTADTDLVPRESANYAPTPDIFEENGVSSPEQVPAFVRNIHQRLTANATPEEKLLAEFLRVTDEHPADVVFTLLRCAPSCDRAAAIMWKTITSSARTVEKVLPELLRVMEYWPWLSTSTSDGDETDVFALAATRVIWEILQILQRPEPLKKYSPRLLVDLLFQISISTEQTPEEVDTLWRECQKQNNLPTNSKRFAVLTMKALLCHIECEDVVLSMEQKHGWDTLLRADTHHYAVGLLAREMRRASSPLYYPIALCLLRLLTREKPCWELPAMAFLVEILDCPDITEWRDSVLEILSRHLWSQCTEMHRLVLRGLVVLSKAPGMADGMRSLIPSLVELLWYTDRELVGMVLSVFINQVQDRDIPISTPTALRLAELLQPLFGHDNIHVQLLSIHLFQKVMELGVDKSKQLLKTHVIYSLLPLFFNWYNENQDVAEASREALLRAARLLKRRDLVKLLKTEQPWRFSECLLEKDKRRAVEYACQALPYLESPQEPVREAALRFIGVAGRYLKGQRVELQDIIDVIEGMTPDSAAVKSLARQTQEILRAVQRPQSSPGSSSLKITSRREAPLPELSGELILGTPSDGTT
ncbi:maestro heat-like repeat-containing protein family member 6 [Pipra filicauda]|uniref:Maestro heat-like repeat-containing protein family member 6 n=1 Tax=Pipra filicauda TaxID=649802 RepID=A0A6J2IYZ1_9PASS|nr:maestro heat-like repeat-containing protein family member 6 [Pipra filicauda]XP_027605209.2 maestro heat-like repeat-containing protein family member 6 [Pipra filicauda]